jgi:hypothetical protein
MKVNNGGYKIVIGHYLDEMPNMIHGEDCEDIIYMIDTGNGTYPTTFRTREEAQVKLEELMNTRH